MDWNDMNTVSERSYMFLDSEADREQLIAQIAEIRRSVAAVTDVVPEADWYTPRYEKWSMAAMLGHLNLGDNAGMILLKGSLIGLRPTPSREMVNQFRALTANVFRKRVVPVSLRSVERNRERIEKFIRELPVERFTRQIFDPTQQKQITLEQAVQSFFLHRWQRRLHQMQLVEGILPPEEPAEDV
jgi:hypothetical protein